MDRQSLYLTTLAVLNTVAVSALAALNETRLDVYVSIFTLIYFALKAIFRPRRRTWDFLAAALLITFAYIVAIRVLEILLKP
ncbi:MAG: hypothetical protein QXL77_08170 [Candidatus Bathyarchaeia archaeon]